jgi:ATP-dependent DNA helicase RecQ
MDTTPTLDAPSPDAKLAEILQAKFGLKSFRKGQQAVLESVVTGRDTMAVMPTGGGKSLCYQIPALYLEGLVIVISPLIALMKDQVAGLHRLGITAGCLHSGQNMDEKRAVFRDMRLNKSFILYLSPERAQNPGFIEWIKAQKIVLIAIDEAHCVSQWGPDFRPDYAKLGELRALQPGVPILALTATATPRVLADIEKQLRLNKPGRHVYGFYRPNLFYQIEICPDEGHKLALLKSAIRATPEGRILIYCGTRKACEELDAELRGEFGGGESGSVGFYHAGMSAGERKEVQERLDRGELRIVVCTNAFGMGIDYPDVRLVAHMQTPANIESLYQEMGRAGRDGAMSRCLLLYAKKDRGLHSYFITQSTATQTVINQRWRALEAIVQFVESRECRHEGILTYFRDTDRIESCGHCDICTPNSHWVIPAPERIRAIPKTKTRSKKRNDRAQTAGVDADAPADPQAEARANLLRDWRRRFAKERDVPAFIIFSDKTLIDLAAKNPATLADLEGIYGLGPAKIGLFGEVLLKELGRV